MDISLFIPFLLVLTMIIHLSLGITVLRKGYSLLLNRLVFGLTINAALWSFAVLMIIVNTEHHELLLWVRIAHAVAALIPWFILAIVITFLDSNQQPLIKHKTIMIMIFFSLTLAALCFTPAMIKDMALPLDYRDHIPGFLFPLYAMFFSGVMGYSVYKLYLHLRDARGLLRYQIRLFIGGILVSFVMGSLASLFLPMLGIIHPSLRTFGPIFSIVMVVSMAYAIVKYRLMDIRMAVGKTLEYAFSLLVISGALFGFTLLISHYTNLYLDIQHYFFVLILLMLTTFLLPFVREKSRLLVNRYFHRGLYDYHETLFEAGKAMISILSTNELVRFMVDKVVDDMHIERANFYLKGWDGSFYVVAEKDRQPFSPDAFGTNNLLSPGNPLLTTLQGRGEVLLLTDLRGLQLEKEGQLLAAEMKNIAAEVAIPVIIKEQLEGVFVLGHKLSGEPYSKDDVNLLSAVSYQMAVSLHNSQLYNEMVEIKQYLENILENMGNGVIAIDAEEKITMFNGEAERLTGLNNEQAIGKIAGDVLPPELGQLLQQSLAQRREKVDLGVELALKGKNRYLSCNIALVEPPETGERGAIMVISDVTRLKELEHEKSQAQRLVSLGKLAAGMAHEIKNPLVSIKTFAELLPERYEESEFRYGFSQIVSQEIERINKLVMELLNLSKDSQGVFDKVDLVDLMDETLLLLSPQLGSHGVRLEKFYQGELPPILADKDRLKQALFNICLNGVQAMTGGGNLRIKLSCEQRHSREIGDRAVSPKKVKIKIQDTGPGITKQDKDRIFDPFYTTKPEGVGIGLSISHKIISDHGGKVRLSSSSHGTTFEIIIPSLEISKSIPREVAKLVERR